MPGFMQFLTGIYL
jgi:hypothetical protein